MITLWGRANSVNVQKVLWCCEELKIPFDRIDAGMQFGRNDEAAYLAMNPTGRVPTLVDGDFVLWESNSILRYLAMQYGPDSTLCPADPKTRASADRWLDWTLSTLQPAERPLFWGYIRTSAAERNAAQLAVTASDVEKLWRVINTHLKGRDYLEGGTFTLADIVIGAYARRWFGIAELVRPALPDLERWYIGVTQRAGFQRYVAPALS
ncbi:MULTISPECIES: glutathione S-transferase N-terminal domain-containing protein [unclassified Caballeronia]|uniref:glutathione S-transferase family protein n=1 Tax=unclassified Caballeronia TaxID=2646786 RepID=UPI00285D039A|nr:MULTISPECIES: glutathione S-transferase N-terminal domain-containing protein [unclassified Caballeronia]MDR5816418.1 glutathione S-transferase N-terminal domain-containing protein [Caballeronia sp. LZ033]MDR5823087.1 glutathione S-transferase N-terminal domain-containing protein [Caballeronia sp. LZ043]MDR5881216.1 glutathione S-transferase N-terminal domain-containing protein [Caballeronia sp. LZ032]